MSVSQNVLDPSTLSFTRDVPWPESMKRAVSSLESSSDSPRDQVQLFKFVRQAQNRRPFLFDYGLGPGQHGHDEEVVD